MWSPVWISCTIPARDGTSPSPSAAVSACCKSLEGGVGATLVVARLDVMHDSATGRDQPVPYVRRAMAAGAF